MIKSYNSGGPNCTPFWELSETEQDAINAKIADHPSPPNSEWLQDRCRKCGELKLRDNPENKSWCRRCRYVFYGEYFGYEGNDGEFYTEPT